MDTIYFLLITFLLLTLAHLAFVTRFVIQIPVNFLFHSYNSKNNKSNLETDIFKLLIFSIPSFFAPLVIFNGYRSLSVENNDIDIALLVSLISLTIILLYCNKYKIWSDTFRKIEKPKSLQDDINYKTAQTLNLYQKDIINNNEKLSLVRNDLKKTKTTFENQTRDVIKVTIDNQKNIENLKNKTAQTFAVHQKDIICNNERLASISSDLKKTKKTFESQTRDVFKVAIDNQNDIEKLKKKTEVTPRKSDKREEKVSAIEKACKLFMIDLESLPSYNKEEKTIDNRQHDLTELQAYQTLIEYFKKNYQIPLHNTNAIIFSVFNAHFDIKEKELKSNNWNDFKNRLLPDIENNSLYSDLYLLIKK